jgi:hypothetical protein
MQSARLSRKISERTVGTQPVTPSSLHPAPNQSAQSHSGSALAKSEESDNGFSETNGKAPRPKVARFPPPVTPEVAIVREEILCRPKYAAGDPTLDPLSPSSLCPTLESTPTHSDVETPVGLGDEEEQWALNEEAGWAEVFWQRMHVHKQAQAIEKIENRLSRLKGTKSWWEEVVQEHAVLQEASRPAHKLRTAGVADEHRSCKVVFTLHQRISPMLRRTC